MGRKTKLTAAVTERICRAVAAGNTFADSAAAGGVSRETLRKWVAAGEAGRRPYVGFVGTLKKAEAKAARGFVGVVRKAAMGRTLTKRVTSTAPDRTTTVVEEFAPAVWQAAAWWLERRRKAFHRPAPVLQLPPLDPGLRAEADDRLARMLLSAHAAGKIPSPARARDAAPGGD